MTKREAERSKNMFALGLMSWLYHRPTEGTIAFLERKFASKPAIAEANVKAFKAGWAYGETSEDFVVSYEVAPAPMAPGTYRNITGNQALGIGLIAASVKSGLPLFLGAYPITPASEILEDLSRHKRFGVRTFQAEDEIAAVGAAVGASFGGALGVCTSSGPGVVLKAETVGLAVALELPLLILDIQRAGPSTGMPTKPEQADLLMVLYGRNAESPVPVVAASTPGGCFDAALEAARIALKYRTPVYLLSDAYLANGSEPWLLPDVDALPEIPVEFATGAEPRRRVPAVRARPRDARARVGDSRARPGSSTGSAASRSRTRPATSPTTRTTTTGWCGCARRRSRASPPTSPSSRSTTRTARRCSCSAGAARTARSPRRVRRLRKEGKQVAQAHLTHLNPFPRNTGEVLRELRPGARAGDEPRPAAEAHARRVPRRRGRLQPGARPAASARASSPTRWRRCCERERQRWPADREGLQDRPGGALVPGLRRLRDPRRGAELHARARHPAREHRLHLGDRLRRALPVLHGDLRDPLDPRPRAGDRDRARALAARPLGLGRDRRRRRALDRRQPPDPRAAPQREREDPDVQQPDLRADEGPVLADLAARDGEQDDADGLARLPVQPGRAGARRRGDVRRALDRHRPRAPDRDAAPRARAPGRGLRRDLPELQRLQRRRLRRGARREGEPDPARARRADPLRRGGRARRADAGRTARPSSSTARTRTSCSSTTSTPSASLAFALAGSRTRRTARRRSASSATSSDRSTTA